MTGAMSRNKGAKAERDFVAYLRSHGFADAERGVATGYRTVDRQRPDEGDVRGTEHAWQIKAYANEVSDNQIAQWLGDVEKQARSAGKRYGFLVIKRNGKADPSQWWCWLRAAELVSLLGGDCRNLVAELAPVRLKVQHVVALLNEQVRA